MPTQGFSHDRGLVFSPHLYAESITIDGGATSIEEGYANAQGAADAYGVPLLSGEWGWFGDPADDEAKVRRFAAQEDARRLGSMWWVWRQACGDPHSIGQAALSGSLHPLSCPDGKRLGRVPGFSRVLSRAYPRAAPGRLTALDADPTTGRVTLAGKDPTLRLVPPACVLPRRGGGRPRLRASWIAHLRARRVPGGWIATGCARGTYTLRAR